MSFFPLNTEFTSFPRNGISVCRSHIFWEQVAALLSCFQFNFSWNFKNTKRLQFTRLQVRCGKNSTIIRYICHRGENEPGTCSACSARSTTAVRFIYPPPPSSSPGAQHFSAADCCFLPAPTFISTWAAAEQTHLWPGSSYVWLLVFCVNDWDGTLESLMIYQTIIWKRPFSL